MAELEVVTDADGATLIRILNAVVVSGAELRRLSVDRDGYIFRIRLSLNGLTRDRARNLALKIQNNPPVHASSAREHCASEAGELARLAASGAAALSAGPWSSLDDA